MKSGLLKVLQPIVIFLSEINGNSIQLDRHDI